MFYNDKQKQQGKKFLFFLNEDYDNNFQSVLSGTKDAQTALSNFIYTMHCWQETPDCPYCENEEVYVYKSWDKFKCKSCRRQFKAKTGTIFNDSALNYRQIQIGCFLLMQGSLSTDEIGKEMKVSQITAQNFKKLI